MGLGLPNKQTVFFTVFSPYYLIGNKRPDIRSAKLAVWRYSSSGVPNLQFGDDDVVPDVRFQALDYSFQ
ncbi:Uncharacterized protein dnm_055590 [Desulfonema magnum]|uniref:Uncharacterized protein n=1 Tax=Desulfonema magnum TaxID=45655 RepID=A0A975GR00_9BACT|nr:Uncharacterized protein dnm_055590 [Desulfonema magnum]